MLLPHSGRWHDKTTTDCYRVRRELDNAGIPHVSIESLKEKAYSLVGRPDDLQWEDKVVAILEARDGTILDVVRKIKPFTLE